MFFSFLNKQFFILLIGILLLNSCSENSPIRHEESQVLVPTNKVLTITVVGDSLSLPDYTHWLKDQRGITFDEEENDKLRLSLLFKPIQYETALSIQNALQYDSLMKIKRGYYYFLVECFDKNKSLIHPTEKEQLFQQINGNFYVVKNGSDTISNNIIESFPAKLSNRPHQFIILVPKTEEDKKMNVGIKGSALGLDDVKIQFSEDQLKIFPKIKI